MYKMIKLPASSQSIFLGGKETTGKHKWVESQLKSSFLPAPRRSGYEQK